MNKKKLILGVIFIIGGVVFAGFGFMPKNVERQERIDNWNRLSGGAGVETEGVAVSAQSDVITEGTRRNRQINTVYCPVFEFTTGSTTRKTTAVGDDCKDNRSEVTLGSKAIVIYDAENPDLSFVKSEATQKYNADGNGGVFVGLGIGAFFILLGVVAILSSRPATPEKLAKQQEAKRKADEEFKNLMAEVDAKKNK